MNKHALIDYIESSFIKDILSNREITDITYNGVDIYYVTNSLGRQKSSLKVSQQDVKDFIRQLANISEKQFSYLNPVLDINVGRYRINAINQSIGRVGLDEAITFAIRIASNQRRINHDTSFMPSQIEDLIDALVNARVSIVISGITGVGKTELQKYIISRLKESERILVIDQTIELASIYNDNGLDITLWQADERNGESSISNLIKNGLRNNPDWMIISESRGEEMNDVLMSAMTGIPIITTIHSFDAFSATNRMARMIMMKEKKMEYNDILSNLNYHFRIFFHLSKYVNDDGHIIRYISSIVQVDEDGQKIEIYKDDLKEVVYQKMSKSFIKLLNLNETRHLLKEFI